MAVSRGKKSHSEQRNGRRLTREALVHEIVEHSVTESRSTTLRGRRKRKSDERPIGITKPRRLPQEEKKKSIKGNVASTKKRKPPQKGGGTTKGDREKELPWGPSSPKKKKGRGVKKKAVTGKSVSEALIWAEIR